MPWDVAVDLVEGGPENEAIAFAANVAFGEMEGGTFDWNSMRWEEKR